MQGITPKQLRMLRCIREFMERHGYCPTLDEIAGRLGVTKPTVQQYLRALEAKGVIARERYAHRSIEIVEPLPDLTALHAPQKGLELQLLGRIAAGQPIDVVEVEDTVDILDVMGLNRDKDLFLLQVSGNSMIEDGIFDGDYVAIEKRETADNGQTVVALLPDGSVTLKRFYRERGRFRLQPANPEMEPIYTRDLTIQGVVKCVLRSCK